MSTLFTLDAMNLFCGAHDPANSKHLAITEVKLPDLHETYKEHSPGGGRVQIEIPTGIDKLEWEFKLAGIDPALYAQFGLSSKVSHLYTAYGAVIDRKTGKHIELKAVAEGRLGQVKHEAFKRGDLTTTDYKVAGLTHYEIWLGGQELIYWDFFTNAWRVNGEDQNADLNRILRVPNANTGQ